MRQLILLRHARSAPGEPDHARTLDAHGAADAVALASVFARLDLRPDLVLVSDSRRTRDTLEALTPWPTPPHVEVSNALYLASLPVLLDQLHAVPSQSRCVLVVGHNPGLHELAWSLACLDGAATTRPDLSRLRDGLPTGGLAVFAIDALWAQLGGPPAGGGARLTHLLRPGDPV